MLLVIGTEGRTILPTCSINAKPTFQNLTAQLLNYSSKKTSNNGHSLLLMGISHHTF